MLRLLESFLLSLELYLFANGVGLAAVQLAVAPCCEFCIAVGAGEEFSRVFLLKSLFAVDVVHLDVRPPALTGQHRSAPLMHAPEVQLGDLVVLLVYF